jgi:hypothetical protein
MTNNSIEIQARMERARHKMHLLVQEYGGFEHSKVIKQSMLLDELINQYNRIDGQKLKKPIV